MLNYTDRAREVIRVEIEGLQKVAEEIGEGFTQTVDLMLQSLAKGGKIVVTGIGKNFLVAQKVSATLASTGSPSVILNPSQAMHGDMGILSKGDILLVLSYSGESDEILALIPLVRRTGLKIIALTGNPDSGLAKLSDVVIPAAVEREACPFNMAPTASTTAAMAVGDALAMVLLDARGFRLQDYAKLHPGGAIGRSLLLRVSDIMRSGDRLASVPSGATVKDAILAMTQARAGSAGVVDGNNRLLGIFTDGDLRRHIAADPGLLDRRIDDVMTASPLTVRENQLAIDVLRVYEENKIDDIPVVDSASRLVGAVDIQDLPKFKIM